MILSERHRIWLGALAALVALALAAYGYSQWVRKSIAGNLLEQTARQLSSEQDHNLRASKDFLALVRERERFVSQLPAIAEIGKLLIREPSPYPIAELRNRLRTVYGAYMNANPEVLSITLVSAADDGREILRVARDQRAQVVPVPETQLGPSPKLDLVRLAGFLPRGQAYESPLQPGGAIAQPGQHLMGQLTLAMPAHNSRGDVFLVIIMEVDASRLLTQWQEPMVSKNRAIQVYATDKLGQYLLHPRPGLSRLSVPSPAQAHTFTQDFSARPGFFESFGVSGFDALRAYQGPEGVILFAAPLEIAIGNSVEKDVTRVWTGLPLAKFEQQLDQLVFEKLQSALVLAMLVLLALLAALLYHRNQKTRAGLLRQKLQAQSVHGLVEQAPNGLALLGQDLRLIVCSQRFKSLHGFDNKADLAGKSIVELIPKMPSACKKSLERALQGESYFGHEERFMLSEGREKFFDWECGPFHDQAGAVAGVIVSVDDVTEISQKRMAVESQLRLYKSTLDSTHEGVFMYSQETFQFFYVNQGACSLSGYNEAELLSMHAYDLLPEFDQAKFASQIAPLLRAQISDLRFEASLKRKDGSELPLEIFLQFIAPLGEPPRLVQICTDITQRKLAQAAQAVSEKNFRMLAESAGADATAILDKDGKVVFFNRAARDLFGTRIYEGAEFGMIVGSHQELDIIRPDGSHKTVEVQTAFANWWDQNTDLVTFRDVTERKQTEVLLRESHKLEAIGQLTGGLAHDFNNMLGVVIGNLDLIGESLPNDEKVRRQHQLATEAALRAAKVTRSLLAVARKQPMNLEDLNLNNTVIELLPLIQSSVSSAVSIGTQLADENLSVRVDASGLTNALLNLVINARDAMKSKPGDHRLDLSTRIAKGSEARLGVGDYAVLEVKDNGPGMSEAVQQRVFEPFFTTKEVGQGTGLGLSMVRGYCEQLGGAARLHSELGKGTTVRMYLPLVPSQPDAGMKSD